MASTLENLSAQKDILTVLIRANADAIASATDEAALSDSRRAVNDVLKEENTRLKAKVDELTKALAEKPTTGSGGGGTAPVEEKPADPIKPSGVKVTGTINAGGKRYDLQPGAKIELVSGSLSNIVLGTPPGNESVTLTGNGVTLADVTFADGGGYLVKVNGANNIIRNMRAETFSDYAIYVEGAKNLTIDGLSIKGGSTAQSLIRFDEASGVLQNFRLEYTTATRRAAIRGTFNGLIQNGYIRGGVTGVNVMEGLDGGETLGWWKFLTRNGFVDAVNQADCIKAVNAAIARGVKDTAELTKVAATVAKDSTGKPIAVDVGATVKRRVSMLAARSDVTFKNVDLDGLRWSAGTRYDFQGGSVIKFEAPSIEYPEPAYLMPQDVKRPAPDVTFAGTDFKFDPRVDAAKYGAKLVGCTFNGKALA